MLGVTITYVKTFQPSVTSIASRAVGEYLKLEYINNNNKGKVS